jgi:hypothetical protein
MQAEYKHAGQLLTGVSSLLRLQKTSVVEGGLDECDQDVCQRRGGRLRVYIYRPMNFIKRWLALPT